MEFQRKYDMTREENFFLAKKNIVDYIWKSANLEGIEMTYPDPQVVYNGMAVSGFTIDEITSRLGEILKISTPMERALRTTAYLMRSRLFYDSNKRIAMLMGNKILIDNGC